MAAAARLMRGTAASVTVAAQMVTWL